jgi:hypothetical protein
LERCVIEKTVMPGLVPGIHVLTLHIAKEVDGRVKPGHGDFFGVA